MALAHDPCEGLRHFIENGCNDISNIKFLNRLPQPSRNFSFLFFLVSSNSVNRHLGTKAKFYFFRENNKLGRRKSGIARSEDVSDLYIGKSASANIYLAFQMTSFAIWEKELSANKIMDVYLAGKCTCCQILSLNSINNVKISIILQLKRRREAKV